MTKENSSIEGSGTEGENSFPEQLKDLYVFDDKNPVETEYFDISICPIVKGPYRRESDGKMVAQVASVRYKSE